MQKFLILFLKNDKTNVVFIIELLYKYIQADNYSLQPLHVRASMREIKNILETCLPIKYFRGNVQKLLLFATQN